MRMAILLPMNVVEEAVYVLHAFAKRTRQTPQTDIDLARKRLSDLTRRRAKPSEAR